MIYSKIFKFAFASISFAVLTACNSKNEEAKKLGFSSVEEMNEIHAQGWHTKNRYEEDTAKKYGYSSVSEWKTAEENKRKQEIFEKEWKIKGTHFLMITCVAYGYHLAESAMTISMQSRGSFAPEKVELLSQRNPYETFCSFAPSHIIGGGKTWIHDNAKIKILDRIGDQVFWYAEYPSKKSIEEFIGMSGYTIYRQ